MSRSRAYFHAATHAQGLANYPQAQTITSPDDMRTYIYVSGTSSRRGDATFVGATTITLDIRQQTAAVLSNIDAIIQGASEGKASIRDVVDATVFLTNMKDDYKGMNEEWNRIRPDRNTAPARTTVEVRALPREEILVEIKWSVYYT